MSHGLSRSGRSSPSAGRGGPRRRDLGQRRPAAARPRAVIARGGATEGGARPRRRDLGQRRPAAARRRESSPAAAGARFLRSTAPWLDSFVGEEDDGAAVAGERAQAEGASSGWTRARGGREAEEAEGASSGRTERSGCQFRANTELWSSETSDGLVCLAEGCVRNWATIPRPNT